MEVFFVQFGAHYYKLTNEHPVIGDYCLIDTEHEPTVIVRVASFDPNAEYPLNNFCKYGAVKHDDDSHYGAAKILWTDNPSLVIPSSVPDRSLINAFRAPAFPCNPIPFAQAIIDGVRTNGTQWIQSVEARSLLHVLNSQCHGQLYSNDAVEEYKFLNNTIPKP